MKLWAVVRPNGGQTIPETLFPGPLFSSDPTDLTDALRTSRDRKTGEMRQDEMGFLLFHSPPSLPQLPGFSHRVCHDAQGWEGHGGSHGMK